MLKILCRLAYGRRIGINKEGCGNKASDVRQMPYYVKPNQNNFHTRLVEAVVANDGQQCYRPSARVGNFATTSQKKRGVDNARGKEKIVIKKNC